MPEWMDDDPLLDDSESEHVSRRRARRARRAAQRANQEQRRESRLRRTRERISPGSYLIMTLVLLLLLGLAAYGLPHLFGRGKPTQAAPATSPPPTTQVTSAGDPSSGSSAPTAGPSSSSGSPTAAPSPYRKPGDQLAKAFLTIYLTRQDRNDETWANKADPYATSDLISTLLEEGPDNIGGLSKLGTGWHPVKWHKITAPDQPADTSSRVSSTWVITMSDADGGTGETPIQVTQYIDAEGVWRVALVHYLYTSEG